MFYEMAQGHPFAHNPLKAIISPRPIGWIGSRGGAGDNLAPYSFFNMVSDTPPLVMFSAGPDARGETAHKDSLANIEETGVFTHSFASEAFIDKVNDSSAPLAHDRDEFAHLGIEKSEARMIDAPYVASAVAVLECKLARIVGLPGTNKMAIGEIVAVHIDEAVIADDRFDLALAKPLTRLGYLDYAGIGDITSRV